MDEKISPKKNPFIKWLKGWATKIILFILAMLLLGLTSFIFDSLGLIEGSTDGDPVELVWQIFWAIVWIIGSISMAIFIFMSLREIFRKR
jgi:hypothetical protein